MNRRALIELSRFMSKSKKTASQAPIKPQGPVYPDKNGNIIMLVLAKPGAKSNSIISIEEEGVGIQINARPVDGEANIELVKYVSSVFGLKKNEISLDRVSENEFLRDLNITRPLYKANQYSKGMKSRQKVLMISKKDFTAENILGKLKEEMDK